jgi:hypothetical protein
VFVLVTIRRKGLGVRRRDEDGIVATDKDENGKDESGKGEKIEVFVVRERGGRFHVSRIPETSK